MPQETVKQMIYSGTVGGASMGSYLIASYFIDPRLGYQWANFIGLVIAYTMDFFFQQIIFIGRIANHKRFVWKFLACKVIEIAYIQYSLKWVLDYIKRKHPNFYKHRLKGKWITVIRYALQILVFITFTFPTRKYVIFV